MIGQPTLGWFIVAAFAVVLGETTVGVALPSLMRALDVPASSAQWLISAYLLTLGCVLPVAGAVIERLGPTRTLVLATAGLLVGSGVAVLSTQLWMLVAARVVQAACGAPLIPLVTTTVMRATPVASRGRTMGMVSLAIGIAPALGPVVAGLLLVGGDWRWLFIPTAALSVVVLARTVPSWRSATADQASGARIDPFSTVLAVLSVATATISLDAAFVRGPSLAIIALAAASVGGGWWFIRRQKSLVRSGRPAVLDLRTLRVPRLVRGVTSVSTGMAGLFGVFAVLPIMAGTTLGLQPVTVGLLMLPGGVLMGTLAPFVGRLAERVPARYLIVSGFLTMAVAAAGFPLVQPGMIALLVALHVVLSIGFAFTITPLYLDALDGQPAPLVAHASALMSTVQQLAAAFGTVAVVALATVSESVGFLTAAGLLAVAAGVQAVGTPSPTDG